ncbi:flagellar filament capping protein FliD [Leptospira interrogans]|uniref:Flagellar hook-associated protein 2 n=4 Tax=Leptospira interrogans TaxID=173 RepID=A0AAQ0AXJ0_LEPIR|nr:MULTISPECIES: flagellar filament capping protein FliD [Leptospira]EMN30446.1 flagellar hook-associated protein 2 [Leptospira interrogans serovar Pyrogenes str. L0374]EKO04769.1 flagellar hook-associated protein 2 [Leptospira interrogans str. C10069]EMN61296.1 flagellar hook-associated protein 2 [Leptospira interrogans serovar Pyrogenes str. R168]MBE0304076.1 flagellar filament capping protein FliD [Leptospira interrogans serovar Yeoncheon]QOI41500.1 flagellar filament capping protein FliD [
MPAFTIPGLSSGQDTNLIVKKLVELEAKPIRRLEQQNSFNKAQSKAWNDLKTVTTDLQEKTRALISFTAPFAMKSIVSEPEGIISGDASRSASSGKRRIEIKELATSHQISGEKTDVNKQIPAGKFKIFSGDSEKEIEFSGGTIRDLASSIKVSAAGLVNTGLVKVDGDNYVLTLTAAFSGKDRKLKFEDSNGVLQAANLVGATEPADPPKELNFLPEKDQIQIFQPEKYGISSDSKPVFKEESGKKWMEIASVASFQFGIPTTEFKKNTKIELATSTEFAPEEKIELGILYKENDKEKMIFETASKENGKVVLNLKNFPSGQKVHKILLANSSGKTIILDSFHIIIPGEFKGAKPSKEIAEAKDAVFLVDGIEVNRPKNEGLTDVLDGVSLNLHKKTEGPVNIDIKTDSDKGIEMIKEFVAAYNTVLKFSKESTAVDKNSTVRDGKEEGGEIGQSFWEGKTKTGLLSGEHTVIRLIAGMKTVASSSYPVSGENSVRMLSDIGINTGKVGSKWADIQDGFLILDEDKLRSKLAENPDSVRNLFAIDTNSDARMDTGVGVDLLEHIKPYTQYAGGLVSGKVKMLEEQVADNNKKIKEFENHLVSYEKKLKSKFLYMEQGVGKNKAVGAYLNNNLKGARNE